MVANGSTASGSVIQSLSHFASGRTRRATDQARSSRPRHRSCGRSRRPCRAPSPPAAPRPSREAHRRRVAPSACRRRSHTPAQGRIRQWAAGAGPGAITSGSRTCESSHSGSRRILRLEDRIGRAPGSMAPGAPLVRGNSLPGDRQRRPPRRIGVRRRVLVAEIGQHDDAQADECEPAGHQRPLQRMAVGARIEKRQQDQQRRRRARESPSSPAARADPGSTSAAGTG